MRFFEALDKLNQLDEQNGTSHLGVCNEVVSVNQNGANGKVTIGVPGFVAQDLVINEKKKRAILLIVDMEEYDKIKDSVEV